MTKLREVEVTVIVTEPHEAVDVADNILRALAGSPKEWAIHVKISPAEGECDE